jgi:hypothetical protein
MRGLPDPEMRRGAGQGTPKSQRYLQPHQNTEVASALQEKTFPPRRIPGWRAADCYLPASTQNLPRNAKKAESAEPAGIVVNKLAGRVG